MHIIRMVSIAAAVLGLAARFAFAEVTVIEEQRRQQTINQRVQAAGTGQKLTVDTGYDYGWVDQGGRDGAWKLATATVSYAVNPKILPYIYTEAWERFGEKDYTLNAGSYLKLTDRGTLHAELGFGAERDYVYQTLGRIEYEDVVSGGLNWFSGLRYLHYPQNDVYIATPGLIYYWGDNFAQCLFNESFTESCGSAAESVLLKAQIAVSSKMAVYAGTALGQRLFDIYDLPASQQEGYILFTGVKYRISERLSGRLGYSYSREDPHFIKRSLEAGLSIVF